MTDHKPPSAMRPAMRPAAHPANAKPAPSAAASHEAAILLEDGSYLLLEDGSRILLG